MPIDFFEGQRQVNSWTYRIGAFRRSTVFRRTVSACLILVVYVVLGHAVQHRLGYSMVISLKDVTLLGGVLSLVLVLRSNSAYDRWWEGRKLWGKLVNDLRNLALKVSRFVELSWDEKKIVARWITSFPFALRDHLRGGGTTEETLSRLPERPPPHVSHLPAHIAGELYALTRTWKQQGRLDRLEHHLIDQHLVALMDVCGACERIRNTPLPLSHRALIPQLLGVYLVIAPLGLDPTVANALLGFGLAYFLIGIEIVSEELEEPFGTDTDDLPLDTISLNIKRSIREIFGVPADAKPPR